MAKVAFYDDLHFAPATEIAHLLREKSASMRPIFSIFPITFFFRLKANGNITHLSLASLELHHIEKERSGC